MMTLYKPWIEKSREERFLQNSCDIELTKANTRQSQSNRTIVSFPTSSTKCALAKSGTCANFSGAREGETHKTEIARSYCLSLENPPRAIQPLLVLARFLTLFKEAQIEVHTPLSWIYWRSSKALCLVIKVEIQFQSQGLYSPSSCVSYGLVSLFSHVQGYPHPKTSFFTSKWGCDRPKPFKLVKLIYSQF